MRSFLFTKEDYDEFCVKIEEIKKKIKEATVSIGTAVGSAGDQWHDALLYQAQIMSEAWSKELRRLLEIQAQAEVVNRPPPQDGKVRFGKTVTILDLVTGETFSYEISSYLIFASECVKDKKNIKRVSYASPIGQLLIGAQVGDVREGVIGNNKRKFEILEIDEIGGSQ